MSSSRGAWALLSVLLTLGALAGLATGAVAVVTSIGCGTGPVDVTLFTGATVVFGDVDAATTASGCVPSRGWVVGVTIAFIGALTALVIAGIYANTVLRKSDWWFIQEMRNRDGFAEAREISKHLSARALKKRGADLRPQLADQRTPEAADVAWKAGMSRSMEIFISVEESVLLLGPPRSGKGLRILIDAILDWVGPLVTTSTTTDNLRATRAHRATLGNVYVFDPQKLSGEKSPVKISPITGCDDPLTAVQRAAALVAGTGMGSGKNAEWAEKAKTQLAALLCAAALDRRTVRDLARWGASPQLAKEAVDVLQSHPLAPMGWGSALDSVLDEKPELLGNIWFGVSGALAPLLIPEIAEAMLPGPDDTVFDPDQFLQGQNTLYLIGTKSGAGAAGGFLAAMLDDIVEQARRKALASPSSRLDPPLGLILDEIANIFSWPMLPSLMSDGGGRGICVITVLQTRRQAEVSWSAAEMHAVFGAATVTILLGGSTDNNYLSEMVALLGNREIKRGSQTFSDQGTSQQEQTHEVALVTASEIRRLPARLGLLVTKNLRPVLLDLSKWTERNDVKTILEGRRATTSAQQEVFVQQERAKRERHGLLGAPAGNAESDRS
ncbi:type IV secretory system conjugative DNA transfer family protein [Microbacterium sp. NPDC055988]|uniref:type IV secretory system conjugative DNA transfer family protein n=1 Tax=Microbacterium sp. NPDC055988 TaxID=3345671 RepID=UPI0035D6E364